MGTRKRRKTTKSGPKVRISKGTEIGLRLDAAHVVSLSGREATEADFLAVEHGMQRPRTHTINLAEDTGYEDDDSGMPMLLVGPDEEPPNAIFAAGLDGGIMAIYRREVIIEDVLINIAMLFRWHSEPVLDFRDEEELVLRIARENYASMAYPFMTSQANAMYKLMGRVHGIGDFPPDAVTSFDTIDEVYSSPVADALRDGTSLS